MSSCLYTLSKNFFGDIRTGFHRLEGLFLILVWRRRLNLVNSKFTTFRPALLGLLPNACIFRRLCRKRVEALIHSEVALRDLPCS